MKPDAADRLALAEARLAAAESIWRSHCHHMGQAAATLTTDELRRQEQERDRLYRALRRRQQQVRHWRREAGVPL